MSKQDVALYAHWPFCLAKCPYCDFNSHVSSSVDHAVWRDRFGAELLRVADEIGKRRVTTIFFGGGTPSLMEPETVASVIDMADQLFGLSPDAEITLEANPTSAESKNFQGYRTAGVNRLSLGVQSLIDDELKKLGRMHTAREAIEAVELAQRIFSRTSFDLIYARPQQSLADWTEELAQAIHLATDHLSLYQLTIEPDTPFFELAKKGSLRTPEENAAADLYEATEDLCGAAGLLGYEISNYAAPGAESRHNLIYWRGQEYIGIGPGAHGRLRQGERWVATKSFSDPMTWLAANDLHTDSGPIGFEHWDDVSPEERAEEYLLMALRLEEGLSLAEHAKLGGRGLDLARIADLAAADLVELQGDRLRVKRQGRLLLNRIIAEIAA
jgi:oxygen-independent coproporphyrinogen-3 oxidase